MVRFERKTIGARSEKEQNMKKEMDSVENYEGARESRD